MIALADGLFRAADAGIHTHETVCAFFELHTAAMKDTVCPTP